MVTSPDNTIITVKNAILTDANGNQWFIDSAGRIVVNGVVDQTTGNVQVLAYENGQVWQMNTADLWWEKTLPTDQWSPAQGTTTSPLRNVASPNGDNFTAVGPSITDSDDNTWTIKAAGQVAVNGVPDPTTANVDELAYYNGLIWQKNAGNHWYSKTSAAAHWVGWPGSSVPLPIPNVSYNDSRIGALGILTDANGNVWSLANGGNRSMQVSVDGAIDPTTANVVEMAIVNGVIWQENTAGLWFSKTTPASAWSTGTTASPITVTAGLPSSLVWVGGGNNLASNPADWSPGVAPRSGDVLSMSSGTMNIVGNALAGDLLTIAPGLTGGASVSATINTRGAAVLNLALNNGGFRFSSHVDIGIAAGSKLTLNANVGVTALTVSGGTVAFTGSSTFSGSAIFDANLTGYGTVSTVSGNTIPGSMEINGAVGSGLTFIMGSTNATSDLTIDHPRSFAGLIQLTSSPVTLGHVAFMGIHATSAELLNDTLQMFDGSKLVDTARFSNPAELSVQLHQTSAGVILTAGLYNDTAGAGAAIPITT
jgi:hypothetical protein